MPEVVITRLEEVGDRTFAVEVETPPGFEAYPGQFVLVRATIDGEDETGYYTISSPDVEGAFEMTVAVDPDGTLGPWLVDRTVGERLTLAGPYGDIQYTGDGAATVFARGPGIGPAVGIAERARGAGHDVTVVYGGVQPAHDARLSELEADGAVVIRSATLDSVVSSLDLSDRQTYVFGFQGFIDEVRTVLTDAGVDLDDVEMESFGPE